MFERISDENNDSSNVETFSIAGITESVVIDRDEYGIPHIQANNLHHGIFA